MSIKKTEEVQFERLLDIMQEWEVGEVVTASRIQRAVRMGYTTAKRFMDVLVERGHLKPEEAWVGSTVNGIRKEGTVLIQYRIV